MSQKEFEQGLRSIYELLLKRAPEQHRLRTPQCPPLHRLSNVSEEPLGPAELEHVHACTYCQKIISMGQALDVPTDDKVNMPAKAMENADRRVSQRKDDPGKAPLLPSWLSRRLQGGVGKVKIKIEVAPGYSVEYIESFYSSDEADALLRALLAVEMTPEVIRMYGRDTVTKRRSEQYGADYNYNPTAKKPREWTPLMLSIRERMESVAGPLDGGLVQVYPDGETGIGWHEDKGKPEIIASLSLGAEREFSFGVGPATKCEEVWRMRLAHGSLLLIPAKTNEALKHRLPPARRLKETRVNVTLRRFPQSG